jgi:acyl carrier protein
MENKMSEIVDRLFKVFSRVMEAPIEELNTESNPDTIENWDSLNHMQLIIAIEDEFKIEIAPDEGIEFESLAMIIDYLISKVS